MITQTLGKPTAEQMYEVIAHMEEEAYKEYNGARETYGGLTNETTEFFRARWGGILEVKDMLERMIFNDPQNH